MLDLLVKLPFTTPAHFGRAGRDLTDTAHWLGSDSLFSAIINTWSLLYGQSAADELLKAFATNAAPFILSSAFPYCEKPGPTYFLPRPVGLNLDILCDSKPKKAKKITWLPWQALAEIGMGAIPHGYIAHGIFLLPPGRTEPLLRERELPRVGLDSLTAASNIYNINVVHFAADAGLYFLVKIQEVWLDKFKAVIRLLGEEGIGGERSYGLGRFRVNEDIYLPIPAWPLQGEPALLLSAYYPAPGELNGLSAGMTAYTLRSCGGYVYRLGDTGVRRPFIRLFAEGSLCTFRPAGCLADVTPPGYAGGRVYRNGLAYTLPWKGC